MDKSLTAQTDIYMKNNNKNEEILQLSDNEEDNSSESESLQNTEPIETDPVKIFNSRELFYFKLIDKFFRSCSKKQIEQMLQIIDGTSEISLRVLDWVVTRYSKKNIDYEIINDNIDETFDIHISYKAQLKSFKKRYFDPFRRRKKFYYNYDTSDKDKLLYTTLGQLNFFKWAISCGIIQFVENNIKNILSAMNVSNKEDKKKKDKKKLISKKLELTSNKSKEEQNINVKDVDNKVCKPKNKKDSASNDSKKDILDNKKINIKATKNIIDDEMEIVLNFN